MSGAEVSISGFARVAACGGAIAMLALLAALVRVLAGPHQLGLVVRLVVGADGRISSSKSLALAWCVVAGFAVLEVAAENLLAGSVAPLVSVPTNLLIAIGSSAVTVVSAHGITNAYLARGLIAKPQSSTPSWAELVCDDDGKLDLGKVQLVYAAVIALVLYLTRLLARPLGVVADVPDIESILMALMGLSQGGYLAAKFTSVAVPRVTSVSDEAVPPGAKVAICGHGFGRLRGQVTFDDAPGVVETWADDRITCSVPARRDANTPWRPGERLRLSVFTNGRAAYTPLGLVIE